MNEQNFLNIHVLISHSPSCLNRDDMNMQKSAFFGGIRRVRISSQSLKRAFRTCDYYQKHLGESSIRTRQIEKLKHRFAEQLKDEFPFELVSETVNRFIKSSKKEEPTESTNENEAESGELVSESVDFKKEKGVAVAPWFLAEIRELCRIVKTVKNQGLSEEELSKAEQKAAKKKGSKKKDKQAFIDELIDKKIEAAIDPNAIRKAVSKAVDIALSGRMATSGLMTTIDGAMAVAHAISTHAVDADIDWFTAVDDLVADVGDVGAGHLNTQEFSAGVFYRFASLNIGQLRVNMGAVSREKALDIGAHLVRMLATIVPTAKQNSFAAYNMADFVIASLSDMPISLANAFEKPVERDRKGGFVEPSIASITEYWNKIYQGYGLKDKTAGFSLRQTEFKPTLKTLAELESWIRQNGPEIKGE